MSHVDEPRFLDWLTVYMDTATSSSFAAEFDKSHRGKFKKGDEITFEGTITATEEKKFKKGDSGEPIFAGIIKATGAKSCRLIEQDVLPTEGSATNRDQTGETQKITEAFLPHKVGATAEYDIEIPGVGIAKHRLSYESGGKINSTVVSIGGEFVNQHLSPNTRVVRGGFVGVLNQDGGWVQSLKLGAKRGDAWEQNGVKYELEGFSTHALRYDKKTRATVTVLSTYENNMDIRAVYVKGIGLLSKDGNSPAGRVHWELKEQQKEWNLTKAERAFYE